MKEGMRMPGFTADASLCNPRRHYNLGVNRSVDGQVVIPQAEKCDEPCFWSTRHQKCVCPPSWWYFPSWYLLL